jgi:hypothetical protein
MVQIVTYEVLRKLGNVEITAQKAEFLRLSASIM